MFTTDSDTGVSLHCRSVRNVVVSHQARADAINVFHSLVCNVKRLKPSYRELSQYCTAQLHAHQNNIFETVKPATSRLPDHFSARAAPIGRNLHCDTELHCDNNISLYHTYLY